SPQPLAQHALLNHFREAAAPRHLRVVQAALDMDPAQPLKLRYERLFNVFELPPHQRLLCENWMQRTPISSVFIRSFPFSIAVPPPGTRPSTSKACTVTLTEGEVRAATRPGRPSSTWCSACNPVGVPSSSTPSHSSPPSALARQTMASTSSLSDRRLRSLLKSTVKDSAGGSLGVMRVAPPVAEG